MPDRPDRPGLSRPLSRLWLADGRDARPRAAVDACRARALQAQQHHLRQSHDAYRGERAATLFGRWLVVIVLLVAPLAAGDSAESLGTPASGLFVPTTEEDRRLLRLPHPAAPRSGFLSAFSLGRSRAGLVSHRGLSLSRFAGSVGHDAAAFGRARACTASAGCCYSPVGYYRNPDRTRLVLHGILRVASFAVE